MGKEGSLQALSGRTEGEIGFVKRSIETLVRSFEIEFYPRVWGKFDARGLSHTARAGVRSCGSSLGKAYRSRDWGGSVVPAIILPDICFFIVFWTAKQREAALGASLAKIYNWYLVYAGMLSLPFSSSRFEL